MKNVYIKVIICMLLLFQAVSGFSKGDYFFPEMPFKDVSMKEIDKGRTLKIIKGLREYKRIFGPTDIYDSFNHFYLSDIDNDKKNELIYYGQISAQGKWSIIWKIDHREYRLLGELFGRIVGINDSLYLATLAPDCRDSACDCANLYHIMEESVDFIGSVAIFNGGVIPESLPIKKKILIENTCSVLRTQPVINDKQDSTNMEKYGVLRGNTIAELNKGTFATATATYTDDSGRVWWFLVLDNPLNAPYNVFKQYKDSKRRICGWISAQYLYCKEIH
jgi:hypothetical protein